MIQVTLTTHARKSFLPSVFATVLVNAKRHLCLMFPTANVYVRKGKLLIAVVTIVSQVRIKVIYFSIAADRLT